MGLSADTLALIRRLPEKQRLVVLARFAYGLTPRETATALGLTVETERVTLHRALRALRGMMRASHEASHARHA